MKGKFQTFIDKITKSKYSELLCKLPLWVLLFTNITTNLSFLYACAYMKHKEGILVVEIVDFWHEDGFAYVSLFQFVIFVLGLLINNKLRNRLYLLIGFLSYIIFTFIVNELIYKH